MTDKKYALILLLVFLAAFFIPFGKSNVQNAALEAFLMLQDYARQHVLLCLIPAFFIAGAIGVFISKDSIIKYLGPKANKVLSYGVASCSGTVLAVCSCTVLPLFAGIYTRGAGIGPATAFLYSGPAINVLAIIMTGKVLGWQLGLARAVGAIAFAVVIGLLMQALFGRECQEERDGSAFAAEKAGSRDERSLGRTALYFAVMIAILVIINWGKSDPSLAVWHAIYRAKWAIGGILAAVLAVMILRWFEKGELKEWTAASWGIAKQIFPLIFCGVLVAVYLLGRPGHERRATIKSWTSSSSSRWRPSEAASMPTSWRAFQKSGSAAAGRMSSRALAVRAANSTTMARKSPAAISGLNRALRKASSSPKTG